MKLLRPLLVAFLLLVPMAGICANPAAEAAFDRGQSLEAAKDYRGALASFREATKADPSFALPYAEIGNCHYYLGDKKSALQAYEIYLSMAPNDRVYQKFAVKLRTQLGEAPPASAPEVAPELPLAVTSTQTGIKAGPASDPGRDMVVELVPNPRNKKSFMILNEIFTPIGLGIDLSYFSSRRHNWGLGYTGGSSAGNSFFIFHPRYRYYQAQAYWSPFFEAGAVLLSASSGTTGASMTAGDLGFGVNMVNEGPMTVEFLLSLTAGTISSRGGSSNYSYPFALPLIGFAWGVVF